MTDKIIESVLEVRAVAGLNDIGDLTLKDGKNIEELLNAQEKEKEESTKQRDRE